VITYVLLTGRPPFYGQDNISILRKIISDELAWPKTRKVSVNAKYFVKSLMEKDPARRPSAKEALADKWVLFDSTKVFRRSIAHMRKVRQVKDVEVEIPDVVQFLD